MNNKILNIVFCAAIAVFGILTLAVLVKVVLDMDEIGKEVNKWGEEYTELYKDAVFKFSDMSSPEDTILGEIDKERLKAPTLAKLYDTVSSKYYGLYIQVTEKNAYIPVLQIDTTNDSILELNNYFDEDDETNVNSKDSLIKALSTNKMRDIIKEFKMAERCDSLSLAKFGLNQKYYFGQSKLIKTAEYIKVMQIMLLVLVLMVIVILVYMMLRKGKNEQAQLWKTMALETAHQLGTPISGLEGWNCVNEEELKEMLTKNGGDELSLEKREALLRKCLENVEREKNDIERLREVSDRFQSLGDKESKKMTFRDEVLNESLRKVVNYIKKRVSKGINVVLEEPDGEVCAKHDAQLIRWSVENICKNAADAMGKKRADENGKIGEIKVSVRDGGNCAIIDIEDDGKGMSNAQKKEIFKAGYSTKTKGWGFGLALVKRIIKEYHGGKVKVLKSKIGEGTTFRIELKKELK